MEPISSSLYKSVKTIDLSKRQMWMWIWIQLLKERSMVDLQNLLSEIETLSLELDEPQDLAELAYKAEAIEYLLKNSS